LHTRLGKPRIVNEFYQCEVLFNRGLSWVFYRYFVAKGATNVKERDKWRVMMGK
jgi:hypothetical protein